MPIKGGVFSNTSSMLCAFDKFTIRNSFMKKLMLWFTPICKLIWQEVEVEVKNVFDKLYKIVFISIY